MPKTKAAWKEIGDMVRKNAAAAGAMLNEMTREV